MDTVVGILLFIRRTTRDGRQSQPNALLCIVLPDMFGDYSYENRMLHFHITQRNNDTGYAKFINWKEFINNVQHYIDEAYKNQKSVAPVVQIEKQVPPFHFDFRTGR